MRLSHIRPVVAATFDDPSLVSVAGLVPIVRLAQRVGLAELVDEWLTVPSDRGANAGGKVTALVAGVVAGADSFDDMALLRHGGMRRIFDQPYAPSTLGSFLRAFRFGHVRQLDAVASRVLAGLAQRAPLLPAVAGRVLVDVDDTIIEVHGHAKQGAGFGYTGVRGLNALPATVTTDACAPVIVAQRLRKGSCGSPRGAQRLVGDALATVRSLRPREAPGAVLLRADSAFYGHATIGAAIRAGAQVSVTVRMDPKVKAAIGCIAEDAWTTIEYTDAVRDPDTGRWVSRAEVAEVPFTSVQFPQERRARRGTARGAPDPRPQPAGRHRAGDAVRPVAIPRILHHQRPRHGHLRQGPPPSPDHRGGQRRPEELDAGTPTIRAFRREPGLAGLRGHGVQPDPRRRHHHRHATPDLSHDRDPSTHTDHRPGQERVLRPTPHTAPTRRVAVG